MKIFSLALAAAVTLMAPVAAHAETTQVAEHGVFVVAAMDDNQTCALGASNDTSFLYISYNAATDDLVLSGTNKNISVTTGQRSKVNIVVDGQTYTWTGLGVNNAGKGGVILPAGNSEGTIKTLYNAGAVSLAMADGRKIVSFNGDTDFKAALKDTVMCSFALQDLAKKSAASTKTIS